MQKQWRQWRKSSRMNKKLWKIIFSKQKKNWKPNRKLEVLMMQRLNSSRNKLLKKKLTIWSFNKKRWRNFCKKDLNRNNYKPSIIELKNNLTISFHLSTKQIWQQLSSKETSNLIQSLSNRWILSLKPVNYHRDQLMLSSRLTTTKIGISMSGQQINSKTVSSWSEKS